MIAKGPLLLRVSEIVPLGERLKRVVLQATDGSLLPTPLPGAHIVVQLDGHTTALRNAYSLVNHPEDRSRYEIIVRRTEGVRGGSAYIHDHLRVGDLLPTSAPDSQFRLRSLARKHVMISGGIGLTPFLSFLPILIETRAQYELHHFVRPDEVELFEHLLQTASNRRLRVHPGDNHRFVERLSAQPLGTQLYMCGPEPMMEELRLCAAEVGWPASSIHQENFAALGGNPFTLKLARSGRTIEVSEHQSMLEAIELAGVDAQSLCRGGACGQCRATVLEGTPEHRDHYLTEDEKRAGHLVMPCVSRSITPVLTLDL